MRESEDILRCVLRGWQKDMCTVSTSSWTPGILPIPIPLFMFGTLEQNCEKLKLIAPLPPTHLTLPDLTLLHPLL